MSETFSIIGKTFTAIDGMEEGHSQITFTLASGEKLFMFADEDYSNIRLIDVTGDVEDLINSSIISYEEVDNLEVPPDYSYENYSHTWTFYKFQSMKGFVTLRWLGESSGWYSECVNFYALPTNTDRHATRIPVVSVAANEQASGEAS